MKSKLLFLVGVAATVVVVLLLTLGDTGRPPETLADPGRYSFDVVLCDGKGGHNDPKCTKTGTSDGDGDGIIEAGENPEMITIVFLDPPPSVGGQAFMDMASTIWDGLVPAPGTDFVDGDIVGEIDFAMQSNLQAPGSTNVSSATGQPPLCGLNPMGDVYPIYDADMRTLTDLDKSGGQGAGLIAVTDLNGSGYDDTQEDLLDANGTEEDVNDDGDGATDEDPVNGIDDDGDCVGDPPSDPPGWGPCSVSGGVDEDGGSNGLYDGVDLMPASTWFDIIPAIDASETIGDFVSRGFGVANVETVSGSEVNVDINILVYDLVDGGYWTVATVDYPAVGTTEPGVPVDNLFGQTVITCAPFDMATRSYGVSQGNHAACARAGCVAAGAPAPDIAGGVVNRTAEEGKHFFYQNISSTENYDGDMASAPFDSCSHAVSIDSDLPPYPPGDNDPFGDRWDSACDVRPASMDNDGDTQVSNTAPGTGTRPNDGDNCNQSYIRGPDGIPGNADDAKWDCDQDVDGDTTLNTIDSCPTTPDGDATEDGMEDGSGPVPEGTGDCNDGIDNDGDCVADTNDDTVVCGPGDVGVDANDAECYDYIDWQWDRDSDGVGDLCDPAISVRGDGSGYYVDAHPHDLLGGDPATPTVSPTPGGPVYFHDHDVRCEDFFAVPSIEIEGDGHDCIVLVDTDANTVADWEDLNSSTTYEVGDTADPAADADGDGHTDGCEAVKGTDPLDPDSMPGPPATPGGPTPTGTPAPPTGDCDGDGTSDYDEVDQGSDFTEPGIATVTPTATPEPKGAVEAECTHRVTGTEPLEVDIVCHLTSGPADPTPTGTPAAPIPTPVHDWEVIYNDQVPAWPDPPLEPVECTITVDGNSSSSDWTGYILDLDGDSIIETAKCRDGVGDDPWAPDTCRDMHVRVAAGTNPDIGSPIYVHLTGLDQSNVGLIESVESPDLPEACGVAPTPTATPACTDREGDTACNNPSTDPDDDGCTNAQEIALGDTFNGDAWYDVYDVVVPAKEDAVGDGYGDDLPPIGANGKRNKVVDIGDVLAVLFYAFADQGGPPNANGVAYDAVKGWDGDGDTDNDASPIHDIPEGLKYDRTPGLPPSSDTGNDPVGAPNGAIDIGDVLGALGQAFKVDCS